MLTALVGDVVLSDERGAGYGAYGIVRDLSLIIGSPSRRSSSRIFKKFS